MIIQNNPVIPTYRANRQAADKVNFTGRARFAKELADESLLTKFSVKFAEIGGEKVANIVNAGSKFAIAPFVIAFNPFSKEEKETRVYSAWKQPIEAVLTISIQLLALDKLGNYIDKLSNKGKLGKGFNLKNLTKQADIDLVNRRLDVFKDRVGIAAALAAIPIVTSITNWAYPKFMEKVKPQNYKIDLGGA